MTVYKRLLQADENQIELLNPISGEEMQACEDAYPLLTPKRFGFNRSKEAFKPIKFKWKGQIHEIQYNICGNPLCKNHSLPQERFDI
ncbi:MAG: insertion element protein, partial [Bacillus sp. (in: Bacteria)]|nr:insertion element protein [Bacillus sp. (in: firmicutes)]